MNLKLRLTACIIYDSNQNKIIRKHTPINVHI
jgi:hypothetical protein